MIVAIVILSLAVVLLAVLVVCYEREFRRFAHFLAHRNATSNQRLAVELRTRGTVGAAQEANGLLDGERRLHIEVDDERQRFHEDLVALSHDVRTPLAGAQGYLQLYGFEDDPAERERCVREAQDRLAAMKQLVDQLFEYTKAHDPGRESCADKVSVYEAVVEAFTALYPDFESKGWEPVIDFEDEGFAVKAARDDAVRVFSNLAMNCLKHGSSAPVVVQRGSVITVSNRVDAPRAIDIDQLFTRFYRADVSRGAIGSGLGLAIVARLCESMGATAEAEIEGDVLSIRIAFRR
ncbi:sensor histidine kinase [Raoultibacter phocaeensis]|uniref:sensor histidine kinase n=1 Tax=Raoultibacter phocaeensis TaxID=2479841 RepID=UPI00111BA871|nr:HAMP domain-containing sensor histidine kinase [Raoultibacter phocaeensis]